MTPQMSEPAPYICYACANGRHSDCQEEACKCSHRAQPSRPAAPESLVKRLCAWVDADGADPLHLEAATEIERLERHLSLAQAEIKGHMRVEDELREEIARLHQNWHDGMEDGIHRRQRKSGNNPGYAPAYNYGLDYAIHQENTARYKWWHERWTGTDSQLDELNKLDWSFDRPESWTEAIDAALKPRA